MLRKKYSERSRTKLLTILVVLVVFVAIVCVTDSSASITDVNIIPSQPTPLDVISIVTFGVEGSGPVLVTDTDFRQDDTLLELDIYLSIGPFTVVTPWSHQEDIGTLPVGTYDLAVNTIVELEPIYNDTFSTSFEVVPEPTAFLMLGLGGLVLRKRK